MSDDVWEVYNLETGVTCKEERDGELVPMRFASGTWAANKAWDRAAALNRFARQVGVRRVGG